MITLQTSVRETERERRGQRELTAKIEVERRHVQESVDAVGSEREGTEEAGWREGGDRRQEMANNE